MSKTLEAVVPIGWQNSGALPVERSEGLPCPFCGEQPTIQPWHGGPPSKKMVGCVNDNCRVQPSVTGHTRVKALLEWNLRPLPIANDELPVQQAAPEPPVTPQGWQPIETAPRDGEPVLIITSRGRMMVITPKVLANSMETTTPNHLRLQPTHWMPLPEPPLERHVK